LPPSGWATFGPWVTQGMQFYLQLSQNGNASGDANTILTLQAGSALLSSSPPPPPAGPVTFTANPNPIIVGSLQTAGMTTLSWNAPGYSQLVILVGSANGTQMTGIEPGQGSAPTGSWVTDGMQFFLQNASSGTFTGATNTLATLTVRVQTSAMSLETPQVTSTTAGWRWVLAASATYFEVEIDKWMGTNWCSDRIGCAVETRRGAFTELPNTTGNFRWRVRGAGDAGKSLWTSWIYSAASR
jgi:hypothetical protein